MTDGHVGLGRAGNIMMFTVADAPTRATATLLGRQVVSEFKGGDSNLANMSISVWAFGHACMQILPLLLWCLCNPKERLPLVWGERAHATLEE